jgi:hypothetical protein
MKTQTTLIVTLLTALTASAEIRLFWSTTGITNSAFVYSTALTNFLPYFTAPTPIPNNELPAGSYDLFLWGKFIEEPNMPQFSELYGLDLKFEGTATQAANVAYRQNKTGSGAYKRWNNTVGIPLDGVMYAVTTFGIQFLLPPYGNSDLYFPATQEFLVGAARVTGAPDDTKTVSLHQPWDTPPGLGIAMRLVDGIPDPLVIPAVVTFTPEPVPLVVFLAALRRRPRTRSTGWR